MSIQVGKSAPELTVEAYVRGEERSRTVPSRACTTSLPASEPSSWAPAPTATTCTRPGTSSDARLREVAYPVIADPGHQRSAAYGLLTEDGAALRGTVIIDPEGILRHALINDLDVGRNVEETLRTMRALKTGELCPVNWQPGQALLSNRVAEDAEVALAAD